MLRTTAALALLAFPAAAQDWPQFRGPDGLSVAADAPIPAAFGPDEHVLWKATVPAGHSSPCVVGNTIVLTGFEDGMDVVVAIERSTGKTLWSKSFESGPEGPYAHPDAKPALSTPVSDGEVVVAYFAGYGLIALELDGEVRWEKRMPHPGYTFGVGSSPLLFQGILIVPRDGAPEKGILAFDVVDGSELWRIDRFQFQESHGTPFLWQNDERDELVVSGTNQLTSYDPGTGEELWHYGGLTGFPCTTPAADEDTLYFAAWSTSNATGRSFWDAVFIRSIELSDEEVAEPAKIFARLDENQDGKVVPDEVPECRAKDAFGFIDRDQSGSWELEEMIGAADPMGVPGKNLMIAVAVGAEGDATDHVRWTWNRGLPYVSSPLLYRGRVWLFKSGGIVTCLDAESGETILDRERLSDRSEYYLSPVGAGGKVVCGSAEGTLYVLDATADELTVEHEVTFPEELFATPAVLDGTVFLRSTTTLWAFGETVGE